MLCSTPPVVGELLQEYGERTRTALMDFLPEHEPRRYLYDLVREYPRRGGRCMRPALCIAAAQIDGVKWAADLGLNVDDPFTGQGTLSRVVAGVTLHGVGEGADA